MEDELRRHLTACLTAFMAASGQSRTSVAEQAAKDRSFFSRIEENTFTARRYDAIMAWFSENWPSAAAWPDDVPRPRESVAA